MASLLTVTKCKPNARNNTKNRVFKCCIGCQGPAQNKMYQVELDLEKAEEKEMGESRKAS